MKRLINYFSPLEWILYLSGLIISVSYFFIFKNDQYLYLIGSLIGLTALIFLSKANPIGQLLTIVFSIFYGIISYSFKYYGEMITYLGMTTPIAIFALISWLRNPFKGKKSEVEINEIKIKEYIILFILGLIITIGFYFILIAMNTNNLILSTISVFTSFISAYLTLRRSRFYALGYALNDIVLIILWILAAIENISYISIVICFAFFLINDTYAFINWTKLYYKQKCAK